MEQDEPVTNANVQIARYAMETLAAVGNRSHVYGLQLCRPNAVLWYFDRCGACRAPVNLKLPAGQKALIQFIWGLAMMDSMALGFNPTLTPDPAQNLLLRNHLTGITVSHPSVDDQTVVLGDLLTKRAGLVSRATLVYRASLPSGDAVVLKVSWQHVTRKREVHILQRLHEHEGAQNFLVRPKFGWDGQSASTRREGVAKAFLQPSEDRICCFLVVEELFPVTGLQDRGHLFCIGWHLLEGTF